MSLPEALPDLAKHVLEHCSQGSLLDIGTGPRVVFAVPPVIERGKETEVSLYGWNLSSATTKALAANQVIVEGKSAAAGGSLGSTRGTQAISFDAVFDVSSCNCLATSLSFRSQRRRLAAVARAES